MRNDTTTFKDGERIAGMKVERLIGDKSLILTKHRRKNTSAFAVNMHRILGIFT